MVARNRNGPAESSTGADYPGPHVPRGFRGKSSLTVALHAASWRKRLNRILMPADVWNRRLFFQSSDMTNHGPRIVARPSSSEPSHCQYLPLNNRLTESYETSGWSLTRTM